MTKFYCFDWDDNVLKMPTNIVLFSKHIKGESVLVPTGVFSLIREEVGKDYPIKLEYKNNEWYATNEMPSPTDQSINLRDWEFIYQDEASFREFRDVEGKNIFLDQVKLALETKAYAPAWEDFLEALNAKDSIVSIVTARGHSPRQILDACFYLKEIGLIKHCPQVYNIFPVSNARMFGGSADKPSEKKVKVLHYLIDMAKRNAFFMPNDPVHFGFSDDDRATIAEVTKLFSYIQNNTLLKDTVKLHLFNTGGGIKTKVEL